MTDGVNPIVWVMHGTLTVQFAHPVRECEWHEWRFLFDQYFNQTHTLHPCETNQNQYKYNNYNKHGNSI